MRYIKQPLALLTLLSLTAGYGAGAVSPALQLGAKPVGRLGNLRDPMWHLRLLRQHSQRQVHGLAVTLGGRVGTNFRLRQINKGTSNQSDAYTPQFDLDAAELDMVVDVNRWVSGLVTLGKNKALVSAGDTFDVQQAYATIGNLQSSAVFVTMGKMVVPFAGSKNDMVTNTFVQQLGQIQAPALDVGVSKAGLTLQAYGYEGAYRKRLTDNHKLLESGFAVGYQHKSGGQRYKVQAGYTSNLFEANSNNLNNFSDDNNDRTLRKRVDAVSAALRVKSSRFDINVAWVRALKRFDKAGLKFGDWAQTYSQGKPSALDVQAVYKTRLAGRAWLLGADFAMTRDALGLNRADGTTMPRRAYTLMADTQLFKQVRLNMQVSHARNYLAPSRTGYTAARKTQNRLDLGLTTYF